MKVQSLATLLLLFVEICFLFCIIECDVKSVSNDENQPNEDDLSNRVVLAQLSRIPRAVSIKPARGPILAKQPKAKTSSTTTTTTSATDDNDNEDNEADVDQERLDQAKVKPKSSASSKILLGDDDDDGATSKPSSKVANDGSESSSEPEAEEKEEQTEPGTQPTTIKPKPRATPKKKMPTSGDFSQKSGPKNASSTTEVKHKQPLIRLPLPKTKNTSICVPEAYKEFPQDLIGNEWRARGFVIIHIAVVCYMFYALALVCEKYFMPSLEEFSQKLGLSDDVAGATLMSAGSSAPELFTAILGVFVAKGDVGTGAIVGSAVFNILFVIGLCAFVSTTTAQLNWWPVLRDSVFYTLTVLVLIMFIWDEEISAVESFLMIVLYGIYIEIMRNNQTLKDLVTKILLSNPNTAKLINSAVAASSDNNDDVFQSGSISIQMSDRQTKTIEDDSMYLAACLIIIRHKRLFSSNLRFQSAARYIILKRQHKLEAQREKQKQQHTQVKCSDEVNYFGPENEPLNTGKTSASGQRQRIEAYTRSAALSKNKFSIVSRDDYEFWNRPPEEGENYYLWLARIPINYVLHYTIPDCALYPEKYMFTFFLSILWTAFFSYIMVWMVTLIGYTLGIPDSIMGFTFLAAGTSVPDCYSSIHAARNGLADMAVSNSIGSNVFDILIGLAVPWFIHTTIYPRVEAKINSVGIIYSVMLLFLSLIVTIYLLNKYEWTLKPRLGLAMLIAYAVFIILTCMLEFNIFGHVNPPPC